MAGLTASAPAVEDLADSFPALLFALATGYGTVRQREAAFRAICDGQPLKEAAHELGLPFWTRKLHAPVLTEPLPPLPADEPFGNEMLNRIPESATECGVWLDRVLVGLKLGGRDLALWVAREPRLLPPLTSDESFQWAMAWAWASVTTAAPGRRLIRDPWTASLGLKRAIDEIAIWRKRIDLVGALADAGRDPWFSNGCVNGFDIVQLSTVEDFVAEAIVMENCLDQYSAHLAYGRVRIFSVRRDGRPVADMELAIRAEDPTSAAITQLRGPRNRRAPPPIWQAVTTWLNAQPARPLASGSVAQAAARDALGTFWQPYYEALQALGIAHRMTAITLDRDRTRLRPRPTLPDVPPRPAHVVVRAYQAALAQRVDRLVDDGDE